MDILLIRDHFKRSFLPFAGPSVGRIVDGELGDQFEKLRKIGGCQRRLPMHECF